jgi:hypothetical protein
MIIASVFNLGILTVKGINNFVIYSITYINTIRKLSNGLINKDNKHNGYNIKLIYGT